MSCVGKVVYYRSHDISAPIGCIIAHSTSAPPVGCRTTRATSALPSDERTGQGELQESLQRPEDIHGAARGGHHELREIKGVWGDGWCYGLTKKRETNKRRYWTSAHVFY